MKSWSCGLVQRIGTADSATPHPDPCGGQAPALHFLIPPSAIGLQFGTLLPWRAGIEVDWRAHPGLESGTCFRTNRSCRLAPAHQGMKSRSCGLVQRIGTADSATPHPDPSGGQAPALHFLVPRSAIGLQFGRIRRWRAGIEVDWRAHPGSESGTCSHSNRSCRLAPAHQGMKMRPGRWKCLGVVGATLPLWIPASARMTNSVAGDNYFHSNRSCRLAPAHQGMKSRSCDLVWRVGTVDSATPHPDPCGGQAPALHFLIPPSTIGLQFGRFRRWRAGIEVDWRAHPGSESGTCFRTNRSCRLAPAHQGMKLRPGRWKCLGVVGATLPLWIPASARMTNSVAGDNYFRTNDDMRFADYRNGIGGLTVSTNCLSA